jgi:acyl-[acyl-carrier-protein]-phospholipid O-acyltransferase/long-chain-fatty-acid--[acyl-carrier-protein] ligase
MKHALLRFALRILTRTFYRLHVTGRENIPQHGAVLFVSNHMSYVDPVLISACVPRAIRFLMWRGLHDDPRFHWFFKDMNAIPIAPTDNRRQLVTALSEARRALERGEQVGLFAEGEISRIAQLLGFRKGLETIAKNLPIAIVPVNLDGLWGSMFSFERGRFFRKWPRRIPYRVNISFGKPLPSSTSAHQVRQAVMEMGARAFEKRVPNARPLHSAFLARARRHWNAPCVDGHAAGQLAVNAFLIARIWARQMPGNAPVGVRIAPSPLFALAQLALTWAGKTVVTFDPDTPDDEFARQRAATGVNVVVTDVPKIGAASRCLAAFALRWLPARWLRRASRHAVALLALDSSIAFDHSNIQANITGLQEVFALGPDDTLSARVTASDPLTFIQALWWPLLSGARVRYGKPEPGGGSIAVSREGSERFVLNRANSYIRAELGGAVCVNTADVKYGSEMQLGTKPDSCGRPLPGVAVRVVEMNSQRPQPANTPGLFQIKAASMGKTPQKRPDGWFDTGECAVIDESGFVTRCNLLTPPDVSIKGP